MPDITETVLISGVADICGVSRQRATEFANRGTFPAPVETTPLGRRWARTAVEKWNYDRLAKLAESQ